MASGSTPGDQNPAAVLSDLFLQMSMAIDQVRESSQDLSDADAENLEKTAQQLDEWSDELNAAAIGEILQNMQGDVDNIIETTKAARDAVKKADSIEKVFQLAGAVAGLAASIVSGNPTSILSAAAGVVKATGVASAVTPGDKTPGTSAPKSGS